MRKILLSLLAISATSAFALTNNTDFQAFDNEANIGLGMTDTNVKAGNGSSLSNTPYSTVQQAGLVNLEAEHLFNNAIWVDVTTGMNFMQGSGAGNASNYGINGKVGYAFTFSNHLQVTPYALVGMNNNGGLVSGGLTPSGNSGSAVTANQMFMTSGLGARIEYRINNTILLYADQDAVYNADTNGYGGAPLAQNNYQETSTLGAKFNLVDNFQLGVKGFYNNYQYQTDGAANTAIQAVDGFGTMVTLGFTY